MPERPPSEPTLDRSQLRKLLRELLRTDAELHAFCQDSFPAVFELFSDGMNRLAKVNLLFEWARTEEIEAELVRRYGRSRLQQALDRLEMQPAAAEPISQEAQADTLQDQLDQLYEQRARLCEQDLSTAGVDAQLVALKRQRRALRPQLKEGSVLGDRYRLISVIGRGGFAKVWRAFDRFTKQYVAVKVLHSEQAEDQGRIERVKRGAEQMRNLRHPHIVRVLDGPLEEGEFLYFVMELLLGGDLHRAVLERSLDQRVALAALLQAGEALSYAHGRGLIHRDIKPQNILLDSAGRASLTDFDLVQAAGSTGGTRTGAMVGTYLYAAPEAMEDGGKVDQRADVYSLGMTLMFILHGKVLSSRAIIDRTGFINAISCDPALGDLIRAATAIEASSRPATVAEFCARLSHALLGAASQSLPEVTPKLAHTPDKAEKQRAQVTEEQAQRPSVLHRALRAVRDKAGRIGNDSRGGRRYSLILSLAGTALSAIAGVIVIFILFARAESCSDRSNQKSPALALPAGTPVNKAEQPVPSVPDAAAQKEAPPPQSNPASAPPTPEKAPTVAKGNRGQEGKSTGTTPHHPPTSPTAGKTTARSKDFKKPAPLPEDKKFPSTQAAALSVNSVMRSAMGSVVRCFSKEAEAPPKISVDVTVGTDGKASEVSVEGADDHASCVIGVIKGLRFAPATDSDSYSIRYDFVNLGLVKR